MSPTIYVATIDEKSPSTTIILMRMQTILDYSLGELATAFIPGCVRVSDRSSFMRERVFSLGVQLEDPYEDFINGYSRLLRLAVILFTPSPLFRVVPYRILPCLSRGDEV